MQKTILKLLLACLALNVACKTTNTNNSPETAMWLTTDTRQALLFNVEDGISEGRNNSDAVLLEVKSSITYQEMDGFGYSLTGGSATHINEMDSEPRKALLRELFGTGEGEIGLSYIRISIGASDLDYETFSYSDVPFGQTDSDLSSFSLEPDRKNLIPVLKEILAINPSIKIMGSPWSPPIWMKTFDIPVERDREANLPLTVGGGLDPIFEDVYAQYFVKYIKEMEAEGIKIDAITIQNEPYHHRNNPSLHMEPDQQRDFIKKHLGPSFKNANIDTKIIIWDHNADRPDYPISILNDVDARQFIDGSAFHLYGGTISALSEVKEAHPDKNLYFTEQYFNSNGDFGADLKWGIRNLIIGAPRNWSKNVLHWNLTSNPSLTPFTPFGGCSVCLGAVTIDGNNVIKNVGYYITAHASKFVRPGAVRIESTNINDLPNVAFKNTDGEIILIILNDSGSTQKIDVSIDSEYYSISLVGGAVTTLVF